MFADKRAQLLDAFNQQQRIFLEQKVEVENKRAKLPKEFEATDPRHRLVVVQFCMGVVRLHYQLLVLHQINCSLQQLVTGILDSSEQALSDESDEAERQQALLEKEMDKNLALSRQLTSKERETLSQLSEHKWAENPNNNNNNPNNPNNNNAHTHTHRPTHSLFSYLSVIGGSHLSLSLSLSCMCVVVWGIECAWKPILYTLN